MKAEDSEAAAQPQTDSVAKPMLIAAGISEDIKLIEKEISDSRRDVQVYNRGFDRC